jgi:Leucine rich repeat N-terminal domain.
MCPQSAVIPSQYTWVSIEMKVLDDLMVDGPINVTLAAGFSGQTITTQILVKDNDQFADATLEIQALTNLFDHTNGRQWKNNNNWIDNNNPCTWHGIVCDNGIAPVSEIRLNDHNLVGELPNTINQLADLKRLFLGHNQLTGSIPDNLYQTRVHILWLSDNAFSGILPQSIGLLSFLQDLIMTRKYIT